MRPILLVLFWGVGLGVGACSGAHEAPQGQPALDKVARKTAGLNVPALLDLSIDELSERLGPRQPLPVGFADPVQLPLAQRNEPLDSTMLFRRQGLALVASYDYLTRRVNDLLVLGNNESELMSRAQLQLGAAHYIVLPVFEQQRPTHLLGLRVLANTLSD